VRRGDIVKKDGKYYLVISADCDLRRFWHKNLGSINLLPLHHLHNSNAELREGLRNAGFDVVAAFDNDADSIATYRLNHPDTTVFEGDIRDVSIAKIKKILGGAPLHLLAGCPPCQGFSSMRRLNKKRNKRDERNNLVMEYLRFVKGLKPLTIMMENVPGLMNYTLFKRVVKELEHLGYSPKVQPVKIQQYGVPQRRKRLVLVGSLPLRVAFYFQRL
jgi:DNA (cytosine-5)-methyltransferase 1